MALAKARVATARVCRADVGARCASRQGPGLHGEMGPGLCYFEGLM